ncbi:MAG: toprim domain-containing protein, partial [Deltaproteobacteria bacterium]|nr:toprim domain-containing protein [Deltaproteobacteria bacterium]
MSLKAADMIDKESLKLASPIDQVAKALGLKLKRTGSSSLSGNCPSGHGSEGGVCFTLDLKSQPDQLFHCFSCKAGGDVIQLVRFVQGSSFKEATTWLAETFAPHLLTGQSRGYYRQNRQFGNAANYGNPTIPQFKKLEMPPEPWLAWATNLQARAAKALLSDAGGKYRLYLEKRGITTEAIERFGLGCTFNNEFLTRGSIGFEDDPGKKLCVPGPGILIPNIRKIDGQDVTIGFKVRRLRKEDVSGWGKYASIKATESSGCLLIGDNPEMPVTIFEGEFDAILTAQIAGDLTNAVSLGSASNLPDEDAFSFIKRSPFVLNALDSDKAGAAAAWNGWVSTLPNRYRLMMPTKPDGGRFKDPGEYYQACGNLRTWVKVGLKLADKKLNLAKPESNPSTTEPEPVTDAPNEAKPGPQEAEPRSEPITSQPDPIDVKRFFTDAKIERFGYLDGRGVVIGYGDIIEDMTAAD